MNGGCGLRMPAWRRVPGTLAAIVLNTGGVVGIAGTVSCTSTVVPGNESEAVRSAAAIESPRRRLEALAELESFGKLQDPRALAPDLFAAVGVIDPSYPDLIEPGTEAYRRASRTLDSVLEELPLPSPAGDVPRASDEARRSAARNYAAGRAARLAGDPQRAVMLLEEAIGHDPAGPTLWGELGRAFADSGDRIGAVDAFRTAVELGERDRGAMLSLASEAASRADASDVIRWAGGVLASDPERREPESAVAGAMLGSALLDRGNLRAGAEVLSGSLSLFDAPGRAGEPLELSRLRTRRTEFAVLAGDAWAALGQPIEALGAYTSGAPDGAAPAVIVQRSLAALVAGGRPATAALVLLDHLDAAGGDLGPEESQWVRGLGGIARIETGLRDGMSALMNDEQRPMSVRRQILRAAVRGLPGTAQALDMLTASGQIGWSPVVAGDLLWRTRADDRVDVSIRAVRSDPMLARALGSALSRVETQPRERAASLIASGDAASVPLGMGICLEIGDASPAESLVSGEVGKVGVDDAGLVAEMAGMLGRWNDAARWLDACRVQAGGRTDHRAYLITSLLTCSRLTEANQVAEAIDADPNANTDELKRKPAR